jgi:hypothetical protein
MIESVLVTRHMSLTQGWEKNDGETESMKVNYCVVLNNEDVVVLWCM